MVNMVTTGDTRTEKDREPCRWCLLGTSLLVLAVAGVAGSTAFVYGFDRGYSVGVSLAVGSILGMVTVRAWRSGA